MVIKILVQYSLKQFVMSDPSSCRCQQLILQSFLSLSISLPAAVLLIMSVPPHMSTSSCSCSQAPRLISTSSCSCSQVSPSSYLYQQLFLQSGQSLVLSLPAAVLVVRLVPRLISTSSCSCSHVCRSSHLYQQLFLQSCCPSSYVYQQLFFQSILSLIICIPAAVLLVNSVPHHIYTSSCSFSKFCPSSYVYQQLFFQSILSLIICIQAAVLLVNSAPHHIYQHIT